MKQYKIQNKIQNKMKQLKWVIDNNKLQKNKDIVVVLPIVKLWFSERYYAGPNTFTPAFGIAISWLKWNYYFTLQKK